MNFSCPIGIAGCCCSRHTMCERQKRYSEKEDDEALYLRLECPGIDEEHLEITIVEEDIVFIKGEAPNESGDEKDRVVYSGTWTLSPTSYKLDSITFSVKNGVADVVIPKIKPQE